MVIKSLLPSFSKKKAQNTAAANSNVTANRSNLRKTDSNNNADLHQATDINAEDTQPIYKGKPEDRVIVFDLDETLIAGDKHPIKGKREKKIKKMTDRTVELIPKNHPQNELDFDIKYVVRPGTKELLENLTSRGYKIIASTRNYPAYAKAICELDPILSKYISGHLGRDDLLSDANKNFKKYPNHPDKFTFFGKMGATFKRVFIYGPKFMWLKFKSIFNGKNVRWNPPYGVLGKYPPNMIDMLKTKGNHNFDDCQPARFLVDNKAKRELEDSRRSGDFAIINPNLDRNGDGVPTDFYSDSKVPKNENGEYVWVKNVLAGIDHGWRQQFKLTTGKEPSLRA